MSFTCPVCQRTSHHPTDAAEGYCRRCGGWTGAAQVLAQSSAELQAALDELNALLREDARKFPRGHPCRDCGRFYDEHRLTDSNCRGWR